MNIDLSGLSVETLRKMAHALAEDRTAQHVLGKMLCQTPEASQRAGLLQQAR